MQSYEGISESILKYLKKLWIFQKQEWEDLDTTKF
jgi:hypothetical protein